MIKLTKTPTPEILLRNAAKWTQTIIEKLSQSLELAKSEKNKYNHADIKTALRQETHEKCAYCESKILHITYGDIEHITPKSTDPNLWFDWNNLTLACDVCNTKKSDKANIIDPYDIDPKERIIFHGVTIWPAPGDEIAKYTIEELELNREALIDKRQEKIERIMHLLEIIAKTKTPELIKILKEDFKKELTDENEYAGLARSIAENLESKGFLAG